MHQDPSVIVFFNHILPHVLEPDFKINLIHLTSTLLNSSLIEDRVRTFLKT